jgi:uncharacterized protein YmfQ (DUF2313 family)
MSAPDDRDRHLRRSGEDYVAPFAQLLPQGQAWPREPDSVLMRAVRGLCLYWGTVDGRAADLLEREADPRETIELLPDWERAFGLPDPCFDIPQTIGERQIALVHRMTLLGAQSRQFFIDTAETLGRTIHIREYAPFMCGVSRVGDQPDDQDHPRWQLGRPEMRFYWNIHIDEVKYVWFRVSKGQTGIDPHLDIQVPIGPLCVFERWKPAHTKILYYNNTRPVGNLTATLRDATLYAPASLQGPSTILRGATLSGVGIVTGPFGVLATLRNATLSGLGTITGPFGVLATLRNATLSGLGVISSESRLLQEDDGALLLEDGDDILLDV